MDIEEQSREWRKQAAQGNSAAATKLLHEYYAQVFAYLRRLSENDTDAADLTQETFRKVWQSLGQFREDSRVSTWIHRIAYCTWVDWIRQRKETTYQSEHWWFELPDDFPSPQEQAVNREQLRQLWQFVRELPDEQCQAIHLRYGQQLSLSETAEVLDLPLSTLKLRIRSALDRLKIRLSTSIESSIEIKP